MLLFLNKKGKLYFDTFTKENLIAKVMTRYLIIYERGKDGYSAYVPDLPGCTSAGGTKKEVEENIVEAIKLHIEVMKESGYEIPEANSESEMLILA
jgi:predicted RNase H-like HicB family nuclease